ncbi:MAG: hypothetical protein Q8L86_13085 [Vicinamibacterales bacterium]|nr:hypothetical protein [Vicinamibacterales bacterium]
MKPCIALLVAALIPGVVSAQGTGQDWPELNTAGVSTVYVLDDTGVEVSGTLLRLTSDSLVLMVGGVEHRLDAARVKRIQKRGDSLRNGALIGAVVGAAMGLIVAGISDCPGSDPGGSCPATRATAFLVSTGVYAAIGTGIDALVVGRTTLYQAPTTPPQSARAPYGRRVTINLSVQW